jgi:hypothetical protein
MTSIITWLKGKKTYILGLAAIVYAITGYYTGNLDSQTAMAVAWAAMQTMALRAGITKMSTQ